MAIRNCGKDEALPTSISSMARDISMGSAREQTAFVTIRKSEKAMGFR